MKKNKLIKYLIVNILLPILFMVLYVAATAYLLLNYFNFEELNIGFATFTIDSAANIPDILKTFYIVVIFAINIYIAIIIIRKYNENRVFLSGNIYGPSSYIWYYIAKLLGFKKISIIRKPYNIAFDLLSRGDYENIEPEKENPECNVSIIVDDTNFNSKSKNLRECNLIIEDTYPICITQIPEVQREIDTIIVKRIEKTEKIQLGKRISSDELVNEVVNQIRRILKTGAEINLFMTTSAYNTYWIINKGFMQAERDKMVVNVFQQETRTRNKQFKDKPKTVIK